MRRDLLYLGDVEMMAAMAVRPHGLDHGRVMAAAKQDTIPTIYHATLLSLLTRTQ